MSDDIMLQRAIMLSLQASNMPPPRAVTTYRSTTTTIIRGGGGGPPRGPPVRDIAPQPSRGSYAFGGGGGSRDIAPQPARGAAANAVRTGGRRDNLAREGIMPVSGSNNTRALPPPPSSTNAKENQPASVAQRRGQQSRGNVDGGSDEMPSTPTKKQQEPRPRWNGNSRQQARDNNNNRDDGGEFGDVQQAYGHMFGRPSGGGGGGAKKSARGPRPASDASATAEPRPDTVPPVGWQPVPGASGGSVQRQNPSGTHFAIDCNGGGGDLSGAPELPLSSLVAVTNDSPKELQKGNITWKCNVKAGASSNRPQVLIGAMASDGVTLAAVKLELKESNEMVASAHRFMLTGSTLVTVSDLERPTPVRNKQARTVDSGFAISLQLQEGSMHFECGGQSIFKNLKAEGLVVKESQLIIVLLGGGRAVFKGVQIEDSSSAAVGNIDRHCASIIEEEIMDTSPNVQWEDVASLGEAKRLLNEAVVLPMILPEMFQGIRSPVKGVLLFGPPGTGKTLLAKAVATCAKTTFFSISASTLLGKYYGESEKMVKCLFQLARKHAPSTIFFDEVDSLMMKRGGGNEHEASRRVKSELLQQMDGINGGGGDGDTPHIMVLATTNKPWDLDDAMRRRLEKRIYIPLPDEAARVELFKIHTKKITVDAAVDFTEVAQLTEGYSGADIVVLCREAAMWPVRRMIGDKSPLELREMKEKGLLQSGAGPVTMEDFRNAAKNTPASVGTEELNRYSEWFGEFGAV